MSESLSSHSYLDHDTPMTLMVLVQYTNIVLKASDDDEPQPTTSTIPRTDEEYDVVEKMTDTTTCKGLSTAIQHDDVTIGKSVAINLVFL